MTATLTVSPGQAPAQGALWVADGERPIASEWASYVAASPSRFSRVTSPKAQGAYALKVDLVDGDVSYAGTDFGSDPGVGTAYGERAEVGMNNPTNGFGNQQFQKGQECWIAFQVYVPASFPDSGGDPAWCILAQWKQIGGMGVPAISLHMSRHQIGGDTDRWQLFTADNATDSLSNTSRWNGPVTRDHWTRFALHVCFHTDPTVGFVELWGDLDGTGMTCLLPKLFTYTMKNPDTGVGETVSRSHARLGIYRDSDITGDATVYYDGYTVAPSRDAAQANAFRS